MEVAVPSEPLCIWKDCTNRVKLYSREYGIRICTRDCLELYVKYKENPVGESEEGRFRNLWFIHISLLQQWFYEKFLSGESDILKKLDHELDFNNKQITRMALGNEEALLEGLTRYTKKTKDLFQRLLVNEKKDGEKEEWRESIVNLLSILQLSEVPALVVAMDNYASNLLQLMSTILTNGKNHYCIFRVLIISVANLSNLVESNLARVGLAPKEVPSMMLRPESGRRRKDQKK